MFDRAQVESIGAILLVGVVVISIGVGGVYAMGTFTQSTDAPEAAITGEVSTDNITLSHQGGDSLPGDDLRLIVRLNGTETVKGWSDGTLSGDDTFDPGESWKLSHNYDNGSLVTVWLIHDPSNTVLFQMETTVTAQDPVVADVGGKIDAVDSEGPIEQSDISAPPPDDSTEEEEEEEEEEDAPGNSGNAPGNSGNAPGNSGNAPGNSGNAPGRN